jgi:hypothetical protein
MSAQFQSMPREFLVIRWQRDPSTQAGEPLTQFRAARRLEATNARFKKHGSVDVMTELRRKPASRAA